MGALRLLAASFTPAELHAKGFSLYAEFRPHADGWGQRGEVRCSTILSLRKAHTGGKGAGNPVPSELETPLVNSVVKVFTGDDSETRDRDSAGEEAPTKKPKRGSPERDEFDKVLDDEFLFDDFDLSTIP